MLVLVIAVSILGTWVMLNTGIEMEQAQSRTYGTIQFNVLNGGINAPATNVDSKAGATLRLEYTGFKG